MAMGILTDRFSHDDQQVEPLLEQIDEPIDHFSGDGAYDETPVYDVVTEHSPNADAVSYTHLDVYKRQMLMSMVLPCREQQD